MHTCMQAWADLKDASQQLALINTVLRLETVSAAPNYVLKQCLVSATHDGHAVALA